MLAAGLSVLAGEGVWDWNVCVEGVVPWCAGCQVHIPNPQKSRPLQGQPLDGDWFIGNDRQGFGCSGHAWEFLALVEEKKSNIPCGAGAAGRGNVWVCVAEEQKAGDKHRSTPWPSPGPLRAGFSPFSERDNPQGELLQPCCWRGSFLSFHQPSGVPPVELPGLTEQWDGRRSL